MELIGARFRHGRRQAGMSQRRLAERAGVSQSMVSRFERGRAPGMGALRFIRIGMALGPQFPFGFCSHEHRCKWPYNPDIPKSIHELLNG